MLSPAGLPETRASEDISELGPGAQPGCGDGNERTPL